MESGFWGSLTSMQFFTKTYYGLYYMIIYEWFIYINTYLCFKSIFLDR